MKELYGRKFNIFETTYEFVVIENVKYYLDYFLDNVSDLPNVYTDVYVYDSERKNIRVFYKINYYSEYKILTDGINTYKVFY